MSRPTPSNDFADLLEELEREAREEGPTAVAEMEALHDYYGLVGELIRLRRHRQMTQKQLEVATGIPQSEISRIESGHANPTLATLRKLVRALGGEIRIIEKDSAVPAAGTVRASTRRAGRQQAPFQGRANHPRAAGI
jgi:transcriptional regulator with XRE-family HTH domain